MLNMPSDLSSLVARYSTRSFVGLDPWGLDPGAWKKPKLSKSEVNLKKVEKIHEKSKPVCEQSNR